MIKDVTIGIPVYNEELGIERAVRSSISQCERLIISDNASTDRTSVICLRLQSEFPNLEYVRQPENLGSYANGNIILGMIKTPYVIFLGGHDYMDSDCVNKLKAEFDRTPSAVLVSPGSCKGLKNGSECFDLPRIPVQDLASSNPFTRVDFIARVVSRRTQALLLPNGLYRSEILKEVLSRPSSTHSADILMLARLASIGQILLAPEAVFYFEVRENDSEVEYLKRISAKDSTWKERQLERIEFAAAVYAVAKAVASWHPEDLFRLLLIRLFLAKYYGQFKPVSLPDVVSWGYTKIASYLYLFNKPVPGSDEALYRSLSSLESRGWLKDRKLALYGAGLHTKRLLSTNILHGDFVAIFDDSPHSESLSGIPVIGTELMSEFKFDILIISSDMFERELYQKARKWVPSGTSIIRLYPPRLSLKEL